MNAIDQKYIIVKMAHPETGLPINKIIQTDGLQLVGTVAQFRTNEHAEEKRRNYLDRFENPYSYGKADNHRVYVSRSCALKAFDESEIENYEEIQQRTLKEMADFFVSQMSEAHYKAYADENK